MKRRMNSAFTLIELLVVVAIIAVLMALLMPALSSARESAKTTACASNLRQMVIGERMYLSEDINACLRVTHQPNYAYTGGTWWGPGQLYILNIMTAPKVAYCPTKVADGWAANGPRWKNAPPEDITYGYANRRWYLYYPDSYVVSEGSGSPTSRVTLKTAPDGLALYADLSLFDYAGSNQGANVTLEHSYNNIGNVGYADGHVESWNRKRINSEGKKPTATFPWPFYENTFLMGLDLPGVHW